MSGTQQGNEIEVDTEAAPADSSQQVGQGRTTANDGPHSGERGVPT